MYDDPTAVRAGATQCFSKVAGCLYHRSEAVRNHDQLMGTPFAGNFRETFVISQLVPLIRQKWNFCYYRTHTGIEADLVLGSGINPEICIEIKLSSSPTVTRSFVIAIDNLKTRSNRSREGLMNSPVVVALRMIN